MMNIKELRFEIDEIDKRLLVLIIKRLEIVLVIGKIKKENSIEIIDSNREKEVLGKLIKQAESNGIDSKIVKRVWKVLMEISYEIEKGTNGNS